MPRFYSIIQELLPSPSRIITSLVHGIDKACSAAFESVIRFKLQLLARYLLYKNIDAAKKRIRVFGVYRIL